MKPHRYHKMTAAEKKAYADARKTLGAAALVTCAACGFRMLARDAEGHKTRCAGKER